MKTFLCVLIVFFSGLAGLSIKNSYNKKYLFFDEIYMFFQFISVKIAFFKDTYAECILQFIKSNKLKNKKFFNNLYVLISSENLTYNSFANLLDIYFSEEEKQELFKLFSQIGSTDITTQEQLLLANEKLIEQKLTILEHAKKTKGDVWAKLSICIGLVICILIY